MESLVRRIAANADNVGFTMHAFEREELRGISTTDAIDILRTGYVSEGIKEGANKGEWICKVVKRPSPDSLEIGVITVVIDQHRLLVVTLEWEYPQ